VEMSENVGKFPFLFQCVCGFWSWIWFGIFHDSVIWGKLWEIRSENHTRITTFDIIKLEIFQTKKPSIPALLNLQSSQPIILKLLAIHRPQS
jgi:hypothetical protein